MPFFLRLCAILGVFLSATSNLLAQIPATFPQPAPSDNRAGLYALTNATIYTDFKTRLENATLLVRDGKVEACGTAVTLPTGAVVIDCKGKTIYPAFIDLYAVNYGLPEPRPAEGGGRSAQPLSSKKGAYGWNETLKPEFSAANAFVNDPKASEEWRKYGFGAVLTHLGDGISRGTGALVALSDTRENQSMLRAAASHHLSFRKGTSRQDYPASLMGCIALIRQTYLDAQWYKAEGYKKERNLSLEAWNNAAALPQIFDATDKLDILRIARIGQEFGTRYIIKSAGDEYQRLDEVKAAGLPVIAPLNFPEGYDVRDPYDAEQVSVKDLKHWEMAPSNPGRLAAAGIPLALTLSGLKDKSKFWEQLRKAVEYGLSEEKALEALTKTPAQWLNANELGSLEPGKIANFFVASGNMFKPDGKITQTWVLGKPFDIAPDKMAGRTLNGQYNLQIGTTRYGLTVKGKPEAPEATVMRPDSSKAKAALSFGNGLVTLTFPLDSTKKSAQASLSGEAGTNAWTGKGTLADGSWVSWRAERTGDSPADPQKTPPVPAKPELGAIWYPFAAYGRPAKPQAAVYLIRNATVWTSEVEGILKNTDVLLSGGKIQRVGANLPAPAGAVVIDGTNKHLTAGIIDEHSHIAAARSINEGTQESSAEVRLGDVIDSEDLDIYRQLAGGVTSSHILHGSANPIGGQTQLIKMRWGYAPDQMKFDGWPGQIKFALGENVKQANWGDNFRSRYPQTRMGVEQVYADYFTRAQEYGQLKKSGQPFRKDLDLEALLEILESKRFITCHSYVQSEITMLMRVAERFNFKVNTFTHILEGYKVADKMAKHGAGASSFSDWWAYKFEVWDAIPQSPKIMADQGVVVAINSDDAEMARRLNQEAAKSVMYAGMKEEDAWKMVTINPAKLLRVSDKTGSLKVGKDADVVLWSENPLSVYAKAEYTFVDGIKFFDRQEDAALQTQLRQERARLIQKLQAQKKGGEGMEKPASAPKHHYHCDSDEDEG